MHIPGPWTVKKVPAGNWYIKAEMQHPKGTKFISDIFEIPITPHVDYAELKNGKINISLAYSAWYQFEIGPWNEKTWEANANLIAAAPDLLKACDYALGLLTKRDSHEQTDIEEVIHVLKTEIDKHETTP